MDQALIPISTIQKFLAQKYNKHMTEPFLDDALMDSAYWSVKLMINLLYYVLFRVLLLWVYL